MLEEGYEIAYAQFTVDAQVASVSHLFSGDQVNVVKKYNCYVVLGKDFSFEVNLENGLLQNYYYKGELLMEQVSWYGNGETESYNDRQSFARKGIYKSTVNDMYYPFAKPQDCGNLTGVHWMCVKDTADKNGMLICGNNEVNTSALHFTPEQLQGDELRPSQETYVTVDAAVRGTGNASCGYDTLTEYQIQRKLYDYSFTMLPYQTGMDPMEGTEGYDLQGRLQHGPENADRAEKQKYCTGGRRPDHNRENFRKEDQEAEKRKKILCKDLCCGCQNGKTGKMVTDRIH